MLSQLAYAYSMGREPDVSYQTDSELTIIRPGEGDGLSREWAAGSAHMLSLLESIPEGKMLQSMNKYTSLDGSVTIISLSFDQAADFSGSTEEEAAARKMVLDFAEGVRSGATSWAPSCPSDTAVQSSDDSLTEDSIDAFLNKCTSPYVTSHRSPNRVLDQMCMYNRVAGTDDTEVNVEEWPVQENGTDPRWLLTVASGNSQPRLHMGKIANYLGVHGISIRRVYLDLIADDSTDHPVMMLRLLITAPQNDETRTST